MNMRNKLCCLCLVFAVGSVSAIPKIIQEVLETNSHYRSGVSTPIVWSGDEVLITNHISRRGYNVAGKIIKVYAVPEQAGLFRTGAERRAKSEEEASYWETGDRPGPDRIAEREREEKLNRDLPFEEGSALQDKTDLFGKALFTFTPAPGYQGLVDIHVLFVNQSYGYSEHEQVHRITVRGRLPFILESGGWSLLLLALLCVAALAPFRARRTEPFTLAALLFPWSVWLRGKALPVRTLRVWGALGLFQGLAVALGCWLLPGPWWGAALGLAALLWWRISKVSTAFEASLLLSCALIQALLGAWVNQWGALGLLPAFFQHPLAAWGLAPAVALVVPNPFLLLPLLATALKVGWLTPLGAMLALPVLVVAYLALEWRSRER